MLPFPSGATLGKAKGKDQRTTALPLIHALEFCRMEIQNSHWLTLHNNIMGKQLLEMFKRGSVFPFRTWTQKPTHQSLELPWKTVAQRSKYSTNSWTELLESLPLLSTSFSYWKLLPIIWPSFHSLHKLIPDYNLQRSLVQFHRKTSDSWCLEQLMKREVPLTLQHQKGACVSSILNTLFTATSSIRLSFKASPFCCWD